MGVPRIRTIVYSVYTEVLLFYIVFGTSGLEFGFYDQSFGPTA